MIDKEIQELIEKEDERQKSQINLIPSENRCSAEILVQYQSGLKEVKSKRRLLRRVG